MNNWDWNLFFSAMTGISTLAMSIVALIALDNWKEQQKRDKLINVLESLNKYIQELQLYEIESTVFSKQSRYYTEKDFEEYRRKYIANIFQSFNLINSYTVYQNVELVLLLNGYKKKNVKKKETILR